jgi:hypothetical protein
MNSNTNTNTNSNKLVTKSEIDALAQQITARLYQNSTALYSSVMNNMLPPSGTSGYSHPGYSNIGGSPGPMGPMGIPWALAPPPEYMVKRTKVTRVYHLGIFRRILNWFKEITWRVTLATSRPTCNKVMGCCVCKLVTRANKPWWKPFRVMIAQGLLKPDFIYKDVEGHKNENISSYYSGDITYYFAVCSEECENFVYLALLEL